MPGSLSATPADRLGLAVFLATLLHALVILGISFEPDKTAPPPPPTLDITLVPTRSASAPKDADYLAQANQNGGGNVRERVRPRSPPPRSEPPAEEIPAPEPQPEAQPATHARAPAPKPVQQAAQSPKLSAAQLVDRSMEIASLTAELSESVQAYAQRPREKRISARTREYKYASYMSAWVSKVERIGTLNFPDEARRRHLSGGLLLDVALNADGTVNNIAILRSSGHRVLDDAALRIVRLAAPYAPFPPEIRASTDVLHIIRSWEFLDSNQLYTK